MGEIVRPDFRQKQATRSEAAIYNDGRPLRFYGFVGLYSVALCREEYSSNCSVFKVVILRYGSSRLYPVATLQATDEGRLKAHEIADSVLQTLRLTAFFDGGEPIAE